MEPIERQVRFLATSRGREISVRLAMGAARATVVRLLVRQSLLPVAIGLLIGIAAAGVVGRLVHAQLFAIEADDPMMLAAAVTIVVVATVAAYLPSASGEPARPGERVARLLTGTHPLPRRVSVVRWLVGQAGANAHRVAAQSVGCSGWEQCGRAGPPAAAPKRLAAADEVRLTALKLGARAGGRPLLRPQHDDRIH
jgi:hypothetical protein